MKIVTFLLSFQLIFVESQSVNRKSGYSYLARAGDFQPGCQGAFLAENVLLAPTLCVKDPGNTASFTSSDKTWSNFVVFTAKVAVRNVASGHVVHASEISIITGVFSSKSDDSNRTQTEDTFAASSWNYQVLCELASQSGCRKASGLSLLVTNRSDAFGVHGNVDVCAGPDSADVVTLFDGLNPWFEQNPAKTKRGIRQRLRCFVRLAVKCFGAPFRLHTDLEDNRSNRGDTIQLYEPGLMPMFVQVCLWQLHKFLFHRLWHGQRTIPGAEWYRGGSGTHRSEKASSTRKEVQQLRELCASGGRVWERVQGSRSPTVCAGWSCDWERPKLTRLSARHFHARQCWYPYMQNISQIYSELKFNHSLFYWTS